MYYFIGLILIVLAIRIAMPDLSTRPAQKLYLILAGIPIIAFMSFRYQFFHGSGDIWMYNEFYGLASELSLAELFAVSRHEPGYILFNKAFAIIVPHSQFIFFLEGLICVTTACRFIYKYSESPFLGLLFYITLGTMLFELTGVRQGIAMSICLLAVETAEHRKLIQFVLLVLLAATFHKTALTFLPFYYVAKIRPTPANLMMVCIGIALVLLTGPVVISIGRRLFNMGYSGYIGNDFGGWTPILIFVITLFLMLLSLNQNSQYLIFNMLLMGLTIYLLRYSTLAMERIAFYFTPAVIVALPKAMESIQGQAIRYTLYGFSSALAISLYMFRVLRAVLV